MTPSTNMTECTIDLNESNIPFSCIVDGNEAVVAWQIIVHDINNGESIFDSGKITLESPFYPVDEKNRNVVFNINLKDYLGDNTTFVNRKDAYYWTITFWGTSESSATSCEEVFYATAKPSVTISYRENQDSDYTEMSENTVLRSRTCYFKGNYFKGTEEDYLPPLKRYGWKLCDTDGGQVLVDTITHNQIYGTKENIVCTYNGFLNNGNYSVELYIETQDGTTIKTTVTNFTVSYSTTFLDNALKVEALKNEPAIMLNWNEAVVIGGKMYDGSNNIVDLEKENPFKKQYPITDYKSEQPVTSINIPYGSKVVFDYGSSSNLDIDESSYITLSTQLTNGKETTLFYAEGNDDNGFSVLRKLTFNNGVFEYVVKGNGENVAYATYEVKYSPNQYVWYIIVMSPIQRDESGNFYTELAVIESRLINGLYPSPTLYPSENRYPTAGVWDKLKEV
jgi:hypothetical protein